MKRFLFFISAILLIQSIEAQLVYDANATVRMVNTFKGININSAFDVHISQGNEQTVVVSASDEKYIKNIVTEVKDGILHIWYNNKDAKWPKFKSRLTAYVSCTDLKSLEVNGNSDVFINGLLKVGDIQIHLSGASDAKGKIEANKLTVELSGASDIKLSGSANELNLKSSGASDFKNYEFVTDNCSVSLSGASDVRVTVNKELNVSASGASDVYFKGNGVVNKIKTSGASSIKRVRD
ncbi:MAG: DUF2807 domain-containing protein [Bacteroidetes bacterium]|nr:DUF2807 domain-containing protein [Bacteroidota bacterium]